MMMEQQLNEISAINFKNSPKQSLRTNQGVIALQAYTLGAQTWQMLPSFGIAEDKIGSFTYQNISKIKIKAQKGCNGFYQIKFTVDEKDHFICLSAKDQMLVLCQLLKAKLLKSINLKPEQQCFINLCEGVVLKKDFFLFGWSESYMFISKAGLTCAKTKDDEADLYISKVKEFWTRFQFIENNKFVVFKTKFRLIKYEFAVPVEHALKWGKAFCSLLEYQ